MGAKLGQLRYRTEDVDKISRLIYNTIAVSLGTPKRVDHLKEILRAFLTFLTS